MEPTDLEGAPRMITPDEQARPWPAFVVWEVTMKCDQPCTHCGSRAGPSRDHELSTAEAFEVCESLARLGTREVTILGGEAYLRPDALDLVRKLTSLGIRVSMQTGGRAFTPERARAFRDAGLASLGVSIDGTARVHDQLRGNLGSHLAAMRALDAAREAGMTVTANTQVNRLNWTTLAALAEELRARGVEVWQVQLTGPLGRAADHPEWIVEPWRVVDIIDALAEIQIRCATEFREGKAPLFTVVANNNVGYFGPHEQILRSRVGSPDMHYRGCGAGQFVMGIESDGTVKACPTLPTAPYDGGNVRDASIAELWESSPRLRFARDRTNDELWGFCKTCYYAEVCRGGCSWTAHTTLGRRGNNPFCYHRVIELQKRGVRETLVQREVPPNVPYDFGRFEIVEEPLPLRRAVDVDAAT